MASKNEDWEIPPNLQPDPDDYAFDLHRALGAVVNLKTFIPVDAFTAGTLGTERAGSGVAINDKGLQKNRPLSLSTTPLPARSVPSVPAVKASTGMKVLRLITAPSARCRSNA